MTSARQPETNATPGAGESPGAMIGRYKLLQQIGEGGFGTVWMAEQREPVQRKIALKIIKLGMDTRSVIARFEAERQALAMMDHPNIAKVLDGGATDTGRPYFVMELVKGVPITQYCDDAKLTPIDRLVLFQKVCHAVQHAHQKGVIHRDLKPSNVLVGVDEDVAVPKVIDFGIAKATGNPLTDKTIVTEIHQMIGTPEYMAPEQAEASGLDIDTRADIYSLGVILYELLTGTKPFEFKTFAAFRFDEVLRMISKVDPPRPSTRFSESGESMTHIAERRRVVPQELGRVLRGDLDWIVMKALEKDRTRRYDSADAFAHDIQRYLSDEPVSATPPSAGYRLKKFVRRNRILVASGSAVGLALIVGAVASMLSLLRARDAEVLARAAEAQARTAAVQAHTAEGEARAAEHIATERLDEAVSARKVADEQRSAAQQSAEAARIAAAKAERVAEFTRSIFSGISPDYARGADTGLLRSLLDHAAKRIDTEFAADPLVASAMHYTVGDAYGSIAAFDEGERHLRAALKLQTEAIGIDAPETLRTRHGLAFLMQRVDRTDEALALARDVLAVQEHVLGPEHRETLATRDLVGNLLFRLNQYEESIRMLRRTAESCVRTLGAEDELTLSVRFSLAQALRAADRMQDAEVILRDLAAIYARISDDNDPSALTVISILAGVVGHQDNFAESEELYRTALDRARHVFGPRHQSTLSIMNNFASSLSEAGKYDEAEPLCREALEGRLATLGEGHVETLTSMRNLAKILFDTQRLKAAEEIARRAVTIARAQREPESLETMYCLAHLARIVNARGNEREACELTGEAARVERKVLGDADKDVWISYYNWGALLQNIGDTVASEPVLRDMLEMWEKGGAEDLPYAAAAWNGFAKCRLAAKDFEGMIEPFERGLAMRRRLYSGANRETVYSLTDYASGLILARRFDEAEPLLQECIAMLAKLGLSRSGNAITARTLFAEARAVKGHFDEAHAILTELTAEVEMLDPVEQPDHRRQVAKAAVFVYEHWNEAEPSPEHAALLATSRERLAQAQASEK